MVYKKGINRKIIGAFLLIFLTIYFLQGFNYDISNKCALILAEDETTLEKTYENINYSYSGNIHVSDCENFTRSRGYFDYPISQEEEETRLAYVLIVYKDSKQVEKLLRAIYRTTNLYCIHADKKSPKEFHDSIKNFTKCLKNVIVVENPFDVVWGTFSTLEPEIECMKMLLYNNLIDWKYLINLTGQEFPIRTNREIVRILRALNGSNWINVQEKLSKSRYASKETKVPYGLTLYKGPVHGIFCRGFVEFALENNTAVELYNWLRDTEIPDETFYPTLNFNSMILDVPGAYVGFETEHSDLEKEEYFNRYKMWEPGICHGKYTRQICILGYKDLPLIIKSRAIFANKFHSYYYPDAYECMEWWIEKKSYYEIDNIDEDFIQFYKNLNFVQFKF